MKVVLLLFILHIFTPTFAGHEVGNAAHAVVCRDAQQTITRAESLDLFEAKELHGLILSPVPRPGVLSRDVQAYLARFNPYSPLRGLTYSQFAKDFLSESQYTDAPIRLIKDYEDAVLPTGCALEQVVLQHHFRKALQQKWRYQINEEIWYALSHFDRIAVILHEVIYRELIDHKEKVAHNRDLNSKNVRLLVGNIMADSLKDIKTDAVKNFIEQLLPHQALEGSLIAPSTATPGPKKVQEDEQTTCYVPMQESFVNFNGQLLQLAPKVFRICLHEQIYRTGTKLTSLAVKEGSLVKLWFSGFSLDVKAKNFLDIPHEGMKIDTTSQNQLGEIQRAGPFEDVSIAFGQMNLPVNTLQFDSAFHFEYGSVNLGVRAWISSDSLTPYKTKDLELKLLSSSLYPQEFFSMDRTHFGGPRKLYGSGTIRFKGKRGNLKNGYVSFNGDGKITSVCENENGSFRCW